MTLAAFAVSLEAGWVPPTHDPRQAADAIPVVFDIACAWPGGFVTDVVPTHAGTLPFQGGTLSCEVDVTVTNALGDQAQSGALIDPTTGRRAFAAPRAGGAGVAG